MFDSNEDARIVYFDYIPFSVCKDLMKTVDEILVLRRFLCLKEGYLNTSCKLSKPCQFFAANVRP